MTRDYRIKITRDAGGAIRFVLEGPPPFPPAGMPLAPRLAWQNDLAVADQLRLGDAPRAVFQQYVATVSSWTLGNDLHVLLDTQLPAAPERARLIWNVEDTLRGDLSEVPFEAIIANGAAVPYIARPDVAGFTHLLPKATAAPVSAGAITWPLRCLLLRANPPDLGGAVPAALELVTAIRQKTAAVPPGQFIIDVLTSEPVPGVPPLGVRFIGRPTFDGLDDALRAEEYDVFVFVGHGDFDSIYQDQPPLPLLQLEDATNTAHHPVPAEKFSYLFYVRPVPVALLMGCLTAAQLQPNVLDALKPQIPRWMRGSEGVAQALINGVSGVKVAVGMRYRAEVQDVIAFLSRFFESLLLGDEKGNVESAVGDARRKLYTHGQYSTSWVAPMMFSTLPPEPIFPFIAAPSTCPNVTTQNALRQQMWQMRANLLSMSNPDPGLDANTLELLRDSEAQLINIVATNGPLIMPRVANAVPGQAIAAPLELFGQALKLDRIELRLSVDGGGTEINGAQISPAATAANFRLLESRGQNRAQLVIVLERTAPAATLPAGALATLDIKAGPTAKSVSTLSVEVLNVRPNMTVCTAGNAILVRAP